jgi:hypothetical protein
LWELSDGGDLSAAHSADVVGGGVGDPVEAALLALLEVVLAQRLASLHAFRPDVVGVAGSLFHNFFEHIGVVCTGHRQQAHQHLAHQVIHILLHPSPLNHRYCCLGIHRTDFPFGRVFNFGDQFAVVKG